MLLLLWGSEKFLYVWLPPTSYSHLLLRCRLFCERLQLLGVRQVCVWTVLVLGPLPLSRCGGGERKHC